MKKGGYVSMVLRGMSGRRGKSEGKKTGNLSTVTLIPSAVREPQPLFAPIRKESFTTRLMQLEATVSPLAW